MNHFTFSVLFVTTVESTTTNEQDFSQFKRDSLLGLTRTLKINQYRSNSNVPTTGSLCTIKSQTGGIVSGNKCPRLARTPPHPPSPPPCGIYIKMCIKRMCSFSVGLSEQQQGALILMNVVVLTQL